MLQPRFWRCALSLILLLCLAATPLTGASLAEAENPPLQDNQGIRLNEVMSSNRRALSDGKGNYPDWIEIYNEGSASVNLSEWILSKKENLDPAKCFMFPDHVLGPGECVVVFASGTFSNRAGETYYAPFKINKLGETIYLRDNRAELVGIVRVPELGKDQSYARIIGSDEWIVTDEYTPGMPNLPENHQLLFSKEPTAHTDLVVSEIMTKNRNIPLGPSGGTYRYIEFYNTGASPINLNGYTLTNDVRKPARWTFPNVTIEVDGYLLIFTTGLDLVANGELHTNFKLSSSGDEIFLYDNQGRLLLCKSFGELGADQALSRTASGTYTTDLFPTPGFSNDLSGVLQLDAQLLSRNPYGLIIAEVMATTNIENIDGQSKDWIKLYNGSSTAIDLTNWGLSDNPNRPRKWQFPAGAQIGPNQYFTVYASGENKSSVELGKYNTNFKVSAKGGETIVLATPDGTVIDRMPLPGQYKNIAYGRVGMSAGFTYFSEPSLTTASAGAGFGGILSPVAFSHVGGLVHESSITVELTAQEGAVIFYTTDCTEPTNHSKRYEGPITLQATTVIRAIAYHNAMLPPPSRAVTYVFGTQHTLPVVCLVTEPDYLWSQGKGLMVNGPNWQTEFPHGSPGRGANFWMMWVYPGHIEYYDTAGNRILSQGVDWALHGQYSRTEEQKGISIKAKSKYGDGLFRAPLFPNRDYTEYKSFILRASGQDTRYTRMADSILTTLAEGTELMYQDTVPVIVYLNGEFWGHYNMRERINPYSIAQWEGWKDRKNIDVVKANKNVQHGSNQTYADLTDWLKANGCKSEENLRYVADRVDIENYLHWVSIEMYVAHQDLLNIRRYRNAVEGDGKWRWVLYDLDWALWHNTDSPRRWLNKGGAGRDNLYDNTLFVKLMENDQVRDQFLTMMGEKLKNEFDPEAIIRKIDDRYALLYPEMEGQFRKFRETNNMRNWNDYTEKLRKNLRARPKNLLGFTQTAFKLTNEQMRHYFGESMTKFGYSGR